MQSESSYAFRRGVAQEPPSGFSHAYFVETFPLPEESQPPEVRAADIECLTLTIYHEARGLRPAGREAVAHVVLNRMQRTGRTACAVVWERHGRNVQFSWTAKPAASRRPREQAAWVDAQAMAERMLTRRPHDITRGATHFYNPRIVSPPWARNVVAQIEGHAFVRR
jgi:spore germination cell wall hydrolase CwlJ-like protein